MSEEFKVPPDLAVFESQLRAMPVANSGIDRDQLLYQSGWSAAKASQELLTTSRKHGWAWPAATGLFATLAATLAIVLMQQFSRLDNDVVGTKNVVQADIQQQDSENESKQKAFDGFDAVPEKKFAKRNSVTAFDTSRRSVWITGQSLTARSRLDELDWQTVPVYETYGGSGSRAKTTTELLRELMPKTRSKSNNRGPVWDWLSQTWGDVI